MPDSNEIDWERAWRKAENYDDNDFEWEILYEEWLKRNSPKEGKDSFKVFLADTASHEKYEQHVRRLLRVGLLKAVLRQLGKLQGEPWIQQLVDEQVATKSISDHPHYDSFGGLLDGYWLRICQQCSRHSESDLCPTCNNCEGCCKCPNDW